MGKSQLTLSQACAALCKTVLVHQESASEMSGEKNLVQNFPIFYVFHRIGQNTEVFVYKN